MHKRVLVTDHMPRWPPVGRIRVRRFRHDNFTEALSFGRIAPAKKTQLIQFFQVKGERTLTAVDLKREAVFSTRRKARRLDRGESTVAEAAHHADGIIHIDALHARGPARLLRRSLFDEGFHAAAYLAEFADQITSEIHYMRKNISQCA